MKTKLLFGSAILVFALSTTAQITVNRSDIGSLIGVSVIKANDTLNLNLLSPGSAGASQTWNLTGIGNDYKDTMRFISPAGTLCSSSFPTATLAVNEQGMTVYINDNSTVLEMAGMCGVIMSPYTSIAPYTPPQKQMTFPFTYNTSFSGQTKYVLKFPYSNPSFDSIKQVSNISYTSLIDGWGNVTTPTGTYPSLRQKRTTYEIDSAFIHTIIGSWQLYGQPTKDTSIEYSWCSQNNPFIAAITTNFSGQVKSANYFLSSTLGVNEIQNISLATSVFPNPANDNITIENSTFTKYQTISVYDIQGQLLIQQPMPQTKINIDISGLTKGMYFVEVKTEKGVVVKKFMKE